MNDDEALSAFLDGALAPEDADALRRRLDEEPALARRLAELRRVDDAVRGAFAAVADEPAPPRIVALLRPKSRPFRRLAYPLAAAAGLAAGILVTFLVLQRTGPPGPPGLLADRGAVDARSRLHDVLETLPSNETRGLGGAWSATPRLTFLDGRGSPCRRIDLTRSDASVNAVVCREGGVWHAELIAYAPAHTTPGDGLYHPASGESSKIDGAIGAMMQGSPLGRDEEQAWIRRGWRHDADGTPGAR